MKFNQFKFKPILFQSIGVFSNQALAFLLGVIIIRVSGLELMGQYAEYISLFNLSFVVLTSGLYTNYLRSNRNKLFGQTIAAVSIIFLFFLFFLLPIYSLISGDSFINSVLVLISLYLMKLSEIYVVKTRLMSKDIYSILPRIVPYVFVIILCLFFKPQNIESFLFLLSLSWFTIVFFIFKSRRLIKFNKNGILKVLSSSFLITTTTLTTQIYANVDQLMIAQLFDYNALGSYKVGISFSVIAMPIIGVFTFIYISEIKKIIENSDVSILKTKFYNQLKINFIISFLFFLFSVFFLKSIIFLVYGIEDSSAASNIGIVLSIGVIFNVISIVFSYSLLAINKDKLILIISIIGAILNITLNFFFLRKFGPIGGAWTSVITQFFILLIYMYFFYAKTNFFKYTISEKL